jgi:hypothetical protein
MPSIQVSSQQRGPTHAFLLGVAKISSIPPCIEHKVTSALTLYMLNLVGGWVKKVPQGPDDWVASLIKSCRFNTLSSITQLVSLQLREVMSL